jgi:glycosyltransferase involved in cell wall biosynthesis
MITRKVDLGDASPAGFTYQWVKELGEELDKLYVITWQKSSRGDLPKHIKIISLAANKFFKFFDLQFKLLKILPKINGVFCHQNPEYTILAAPLAKVFRKKVVSWYTHKTINWRRRLMEIFANKILTASELSFRRALFPEKVEITGHGIDTERFKNQKSKFKTSAQSSRFIILSIGRISLTKDYETLIEAVNILIKQNKRDNLTVQIIGGPVLKSDQKYFNKIKQLVDQKELAGFIQFIGLIPHSQIMPYYQKADLFVNLSQTGSVDKAVLEAMACETLVLTSNEAFRDILEERLLFEPKNPRDLAKKIVHLMDLSEAEREEISQRLRKEVVKNHNLNNLADKIIKSFE